MAITREDLYRTVWAAPMLKVARDHGVSPNYLARVCRHLNVPHPPRGYWAKLAAGLTPHVPPLPANRPGEVLAWERGDSVPHIRARRPAPASVSSPKDATIDRHELVRGVRESFESGRLSEVGYLRPYKRNLVDILVTKKALQSALDAANVLFMALEERGHRVTLAPDNRFGRPELAVYEGQTFDHYRGQPWAPGRPTIVFIGSTAIGLSLYELTELVEATYQWDGPIRYVRVDPASRRRSSRW